MKKIKKKDYKFIGVIVGLSLVIVVMLGINVNANPNSGSLSDKIAQVAGERLGNRLAETVGNLAGMLGATGDSNFTNVVASGYITADSTTAITTLKTSYDGFVAQSDFTMATGTVQTLFTNSSGSDMMCDGFSGMVYNDVSGYTPALSLTIGSSTSATLFVNTYRIIASSTLATTTGATETIVRYDSAIRVPWILKSGESILGLLSAKATNNLASSTYLSRRDIETGVQCWVMGSE